jgi:MFS family permease
MGMPSPETAPSRPVSPGWTLAWSTPALLTTAGFFRLSQNAAQTTFPLLGRHVLGLGAGTVGVLGTVMGVAGVAANLTVGAFLPTHRASRAIALGSSLLVLSALLFAGAGSLAAFAGAALLLGLAGGATTPSLATEAGRAEAAHRDRSLARYTLVLSTSLAIGPLVETALLAASGQNLHLPFLMCSGLAAVGLVLGVRRPGSRVSAAVPPPPPAAPGGGRSGLAAALAPLRLARGEGLLRSPSGRLALTAQLLYAVPFSAVTVFGALVARQDFGLSPAGAQLAFSTFFVASLLGRLGMTLRAPITAKYGVLATAAVLTVAGMLLLAAGSSPALLFGAMVLLGIPHGLTFPLALALAAEAAGPERLAAANASLFASTNVAAVVAPIVLGVIADHAGYRVMNLSVLAPVGFFSLLLLGLIRQAKMARP